MRVPTQSETRREFDAGVRPAHPPGSVIVVGAGLSGLAVAHELVQRGSSVTLLEASERAGGRTRTLRAPFADGLHVEAGAMTITPHCHYVMSWVERLKVELGVADLLDTRFSYFVGGRFVGADAESLAAADIGLHDDERGLDVAGLMQRYVTSLTEELEPDIAVPEWARTPALATYDELSVHEVLSSRGASEAAINLIEPLFLEMRGGDLRSASAMSWLRHESGARAFSHADPGWAKVAGGTDVLAATMASTVREAAHYRSPVVRIAQDEHGVTATVADRGRLRTVTADRLVLTAPFSTCRHIDLADAGLGADKLDAMRRLRYASIVRVHLQMRRKYWEGENISISTDLGIRWVRDATAHAEGPRRIVECVLTGWRGRAAAAMSHEERISFVLDELEKVLPGARQHTEVATSVVWDSEPWIEGAYVLPERGHGRLMPVIRRPEGRIHFAGEHTAFEPNGGSMNTALESAARVLVELGATGGDDD